MPENLALDIGFLTNGTGCRGGLSMRRVGLHVNKLREHFSYNLRDNRGFKSVMMTLS